MVLNLPDNVKPYGVVGDGIPQGHAPSEDPAEATELFLEASRANFKNAIEFVVAKTGTKIAFLLVDALLSVFVADVAEELNVPWVPVWAASPCALFAYVHAGLICEHWAADHEEKEFALDFVPGLCNMQISDFWPKEIFVSGDSQHLFFLQALSGMGRVLPQAYAVVMNSYREINPPALNCDFEPRFRSVFNVTVLLPLPPTDTDPTGCMAWLDETDSRSVV